MNVEDIAALLQREGSALSPDEYDETPQPGGARQRRTELLKNVLDACQEAWNSKSAQIDLIAEKLADGSRDVAWRLPYGDSGILEFFVDVLAGEVLSHNLKIHSLRLVGNSCADTDENRARIVDGSHLATVIRQLQDESVIQYTIPVLYNILVDYEPAQLLASQSHLSNRLVNLLGSESLANFVNLVPYFCKILALLISQDGEAAVANPNTVGILLTIATRPEFQADLEEFISLVSVAVAYLANETFQANLVTGPYLGDFINAFHYAYSVNLEEVDDADTATSIKQLRTSLLTTLADISGNDAFATSHSLNGPVPQLLLLWLQKANPHLQAAACLALGNLSRSDSVSLALVQKHQAHKALVDLLSDDAVSDPQLLHSSLSFLKNLAIPGQNKPLLGDLLEPNRVPRIFSLDTLPQVQFAAVSLTRLLLINCPPNVRRLCAPRASQSPTEFSDATSLDGLLGVFQRSDAEPTKLEAARCVAALCRVLHSTPVLPVLPEWDPADEAYVFEPKEPLPVGAESVSLSETESKRRDLFYKKHDLSQALAFLVTQQKWPILRSEAWFVFALMSRSKDGAGVIVKVMSNQEAARPLAEAITGRQSVSAEGVQRRQIEASNSEASQQVTSMTDGLGLEPQQVDPKQRANMAKVDRENCLVLCTEIVKNCGNDLPADQLAILRDLISTGTEAIATDKSLA